MQSAASGAAATSGSRELPEWKLLSTAPVTFGTVPEQQQNVPASPARRSDSVSLTRAATPLIDIAGASEGDESQSRSLRHEQCSSGVAVFDETPK